MTDDLDRLMDVMDTAFDPAFGEAWTRKQVSDALCLPTTRYLLAGSKGEAPGDAEKTAGFVLSRGAAGEEELLLIAVAPAFRGLGIGRKLLERFATAARERGIDKLFLEMRDGNPAERIYLAAGYRIVGRRKGYYRGARGGPIDAITFAKSIG